MEFPNNFKHWTPSPTQSAWVGQFVKFKVKLCRVGEGGGGVRGIFVIIFTWTMKYEIRVFLGEVVRPPPFPTPPRSVHIHVHVYVINFKKFKTSVSKKKKKVWSPLLLRVCFRVVRCTLQLWASKTSTFVH